MSSMNRVFGGPVRTANLVLADKQPHQDYNTQLDLFVAGVRERIANAYPTDKPRVVVDDRKNWTIIYLANDNRPSVLGVGYAFIQKATGHIYRAASLTTAAKNPNAPYNGARGSIYAADAGLSVAGPDGIATVRR